MDPTNVTAYVNRGDCHKWQFDYDDDAIADYSKAIRLDPNDAMAYFDRGKSHKGKGDLERAIADLEKTVELGPTVGRVKKLLYETITEYEAEHGN